MIPAALWFGLLLNPLPALQVEDPIETVKQMALDINPDQPLGKILATYRWFALGRWSVEPKPDVTFRGEWPDAPATKDFRENHRYSLKVSMFAMQLESYYHLDKDKDRLAFLIDFLVAPDGHFQVVGGRLGIRAQSNQTWRYETFTDKALVKIIEALYIDENPYLALCKGLPYR